MVYEKNLTKRKSSALQGKLGFFIKNFHQPGDTEFGAVFEEKQLKNIAKIIGCRPKPQYSDEELARKREMMREVRADLKKP